MYVTLKNSNFQNYIIIKYFIELIISYWNECSFLNYQPNKFKVIINYNHS